MNNVSKATSSVKKKTIYRVKNWAAYGQALIQRGHLKVWLDEEAIQGWRYAGPPQRGAQFVFSDLVIETTLMLRKLFKLPLRQTEGFFQSLLASMGLA